MDFRPTTTIPPLPGAVSSPRNQPALSAKTIGAVQGLWLLRYGFDLSLGIGLYAVLSGLALSANLDGIILTLLEGALILILLVIDWLLFAPLGLGFYAFWYDVASGRRPTVSVCFEAYRRRRYRLAVRYACGSFFWHGATAFLFTLPGLFLLSAGHQTEATGVLDETRLLGALCCRFSGILCLVTGLFGWCVLRMRYAATLFYLPETGHILTAVRRSFQATKGYSGPVFRLFFRFLWAFLFSFLIFPVFLVLPHFYRSLAQIARKRQPK